MTKIGHIKSMVLIIFKERVNSARMKIFNPDIIKAAIIKELSHIAYQIDDYILQVLIRAIDSEESEIARDILLSLVENIKIAGENIFPLCQDTGLVVFWVRIGNNFPLYNINLNKIINEAVTEAFFENKYRLSVVNDPILRQNTKTNTPAIIHYDFVEGDNLEIDIMLKGGGAENMSALKMLSPSAGIDGIRSFVIETVKNSGGNACPPLIVGVGVGGNFETVALLAKKSLFRKPSEKNSSTFWGQEEEYLLNAINKLGIGPMGLGGTTTALKVNILAKPCHIASLPVAVNLECHAHRVGQVIL